MYTITKRFKLTIPKSSLRVADVQTERLRHSVVPIIGATADLRPYILGSGVLIDFGGEKILATAHHVLADNADVHLQTFDGSGHSRPLAGEFQVNEEADIAVKHLSQAEVASFSHLPFIEPGDLGLIPSERFYGGVCGYPATQSRTVDRRTIDTRMTVIGGIARSENDRFLAVHFDKKQGVRSGDSHVTPPDPFGMSGGAIFGIALDGYAIPPGSRAYLAGIATRWERASKQIRGTAISVTAELATVRL